MIQDMGGGLFRVDGDADGDGLAETRIDVWSTGPLTAQDFLL